MASRSCVVDHRVGGRKTIMTSSEYERCEDLFNEAVSLPVDQRSAFLDENCDSPEIRKRVEAMLAVDDQTKHDFRTPVMMDRQRRFGLNDGIDDASSIPKTIGRYRILRELGQGGMGIVYEAEQDHPRRRVALKVMRSDFFSRQMAQRFALESHVLGQLHHPGIAQIYESGVEESAGQPRPYFVMEFIEGKSLAEYVRDNGVPIRDRLILMTQVADAVHHAHQKGVIHRDLKPDNILIDGEGRAKVMDFGVARAVDADIQVSTLQTDVGEMIGTLAYMSPEQISGQPDQIDTRSDVYAMGVMLYELLGGVLPLDVRRRSIPEAVRMIQENEPRSLSTFNARCRGDLDTIVRKAMEKDKTRRYQSAAEFAADIRRYLNDEPIIARRASMAYQFRKFAKRNEAIVGGIAAVFLSITIGMFVATWFAVEASWQRWEAETARDDAQRETQKLRAVNTFVAGMIAEANPANNPLPREMTVMDMLDVASARIPGMFDDAPEIESEIRATIGAAYRELGRFEQARSHLTAALDMQQRIDGPDHPSVADIQHVLGGALLDAGDREAARPLLEEALRIRRANLGDRHRDVAASLGALGQLYFVEGDYEPAEQLLREALTLGRELAPDDALWLAGFHEMLGTLAWQHGDRDVAKEEFRASVDLMRRSGTELHPRYVQALNNLAVVLRWSGDLDTAEAMYHETLDKAQRIYGDEHPLHRHHAQQHRLVASITWRPHRGRAVRA
ncbi:MAG: serine/threonine protein kinase [Phycisphaerales bacterium]|nr:MAG: serine/threonine protein kinase [Phycisphaerales bacterium]